MYKLTDIKNSAIDYVEKSKVQITATASSV